MPSRGRELMEMFHPAVRRWFGERFGAPTAAQAAAWPEISAGKHVLVTAPTGSGKTLTAFLYALDRLASGAWSCDRVRVLYISPLKALNNDIRKNLEEPLVELRTFFAEGGLPFPDIRVMTRSGDTPEAERRSMISRPPAILITTPESLNILLTSRRGRAVLGDLKTVILDEVHAVADSKRGTHLITAVERLTALSGEFQRIALSATVNPMERIARFVGGRRVVRGSGETRFEPRIVEMVRPPMEKRFDVSVSYLLPPGPSDAEAESDTPRKPRERLPENPIWQSAAEEMTASIRKNRSTLVFANSRRGVERTAKLINDIAEEPLVFAHHGSLSKEIREVVETRLREGLLKGVAATSSLELGIDVGAVDEVLLFETPPSIASFLQRLGRAGHRVGEVSRGRLFALHPQDLINAAVCLDALEERVPEPISPPAMPLDVLAQLLISMTAAGPVSLDELFDAVRGADPYADLPRRLFDLVVEMLAGKYEGTRHPSLKPRLAVDRIDGTAEALPSAVRALYSSGGTIPDRGYYAVRLKDGGAKIGELDEEFVWERKLGDVITLGVQAWRIEDIGHSDVLVSPHGSKAVQPPFWTCEERGTSDYFAKKRGELLAWAESRLDDPSFVEALKTRHHLEEGAARSLVRYLRQQRTADDGVLPTYRRIVAEHVQPPDTHAQALTVLLTEWGGKVNRPFGIALQAALSASLGVPVRVVSDDIAVAIASERFIPAADIVAAVSPENVRNLVTENLRDTGVFGAAFRENAARSLLILKAGFGRRTPLWLNRKRAKELRAALSAYGDFPVTLETFRTCLNDASDLSALIARLEGLRSGAVTLREITVTHPTPFAAPVLFKLTNELLYENDAFSDTGAAAGDALLDEVLFSEALRPKIPKDVAAELEEKLRRTHPGYGPTNAAELLAWVTDRLLLFGDEWDALLTASERDSGVKAADLVAAVSHRIAAFSLEGERLIFSAENVPKLSCLGRWIEAEPVSVGGGPADVRVRSAIRKSRSLFNDLPPDLESLLGELLRFMGPLPVSTLARQLRLPLRSVENALSALAEENTVVVDRITEDATEREVCHTETFRMLLRMTRARASRAVRIRKAEELPLFVALRQKAARPGNASSLEEVIEPLFGVSASAAQWEQEILPARLPSYRTADLDALLSGSNLEWTAGKGERATFSLSDERALFFPSVVSPPEEGLFATLFPNPWSRFTRAELSMRMPNAEQGELGRLLFDWAERGWISASTFLPLRKGRHLTVLGAVPDTRRLTSRWRKNDEDQSLWYRLNPADGDGDLLDEASLKRDRVRVLLDRFGMLFRELLEKAPAAFKWSALFSTMRLMELSGELVGGRFFEGVKGVQFMNAGAAAAVPEQWNDNDAPVFWLNAKDPASLCGIKIDGLKLPPRVQGTHIVFRGNDLVLVSKRSGKTLTFNAPPDDPRLDDYLQLFDVMLRRDHLPLPRISIEKINDRRAWKSPYRDAFERRFDTVADYGSLQIMKRY